MSSDYKQTEKQIKNIVKTNMKPTELSKDLKLTIYYKNPKLKNILIKNNCSVSSKEETVGVVYQYNCPKDGCSSRQEKYIGYTTTMLKTRMRQHKSIQLHHLEIHNSRIKCKEMLENTEILHKTNNKRNIIILEALSIKQLSPSLNSQEEGTTRILKIF